MKLELTIEGNLAADPVLDYLPDGTPVVNFRVIHTARRQDGGEWIDGRVTAVDVAAWRGLAERAAESLHRGDTVIVRGEDPHVEAYLGRDTQPRASLKLTARSIALSLRYREAAAKPRPPRIVRSSVNTAGQ